MLTVIGVNYGRTGTASLKLALDTLGFGPCHHMSELLRTVPERSARWSAVADGAPPDWAELFAGYRSTVDWPGASWWRELVDAYPDAKVILADRDADAWYDSAQRSIGWMLRGSTTPLRRLVLWYRLAAMYGTSARQRWNLRHWGPMTRRILWERDFGGRFDDRAATTAAYRRRLREIVDHVPADRLLVYDVAQGWEPLCAFLGVPVPDEPFPHANESNEFRAKQRELLIRGSRVPAVALTVLGVVAAAALYLAGR